MKSEEATMKSRLMGIGILALLALCGCAGFVILFDQPVFACSCARPDKPRVELERAAAVFAGEVTGIETEGRDLKVEIKVEKVWKGAVTRTITVQTARSSAACGYSFAAGKKYLIYAHGKESLSVSLCSRTSPLESAAEDLKELGEGKQPD